MCVHDLNQTVTVQLLEETLAVLSLGNLCKDHGYSYDWVSSQEPRLTKHGKNIICKTDNFVHLVVPGLSVNSGSSSSPTLLPQESSRPEADQASGNRAASSSSSGSVFDRSDEQATRRLEQENKKRDDKKETNDPLADLTFLLGFQRQSGEHRITCTRTQFSGIVEVVTKSRRHSIFSLSERPKLRRLLENQNNKGSLQKTHWRSSTSCRNV